MGRNKVEEEARKPYAQKLPQKSSYKPNNFRSFNPTKEQKQEIRDTLLSFSEVLDSLMYWTVRGFTLVFGYNDRQQAHYVMLRPAYNPENQIETLSCWHVDVNVAANMLHFALVKVYPNWPEAPARSNGADVEW